MTEQIAPAIANEAPDAAYLDAALTRAGRGGGPTGPIRAERLDGGRTGVAVSSLRVADGACFVLKVIPHQRAFNVALANGGEAAAWWLGTTRTLPPPLGNPAIDVAYHAGREEWWLLMDDVSAGIVSRANWAEDHTRGLFEGLARLHAAHWDCAKDALPGIADLTRTTGLLAEIALYEGTGTARAAWVPAAAEAFQVPRFLLPAFLEAAGPDNAAFYLDLLRRWPDITAALEAQPPTLLHGDLRRANIAFSERRVQLFDWELAARGAAAADLTWHWFLHFWAYPPDDGRAAEDRLWLRDAYLDALDRALDHPVDRGDFAVAWDLGLLRVFCQLGFVLADGLTGDAADPRRRAIHRAFAKARKLSHDHLAH